MLEQETIISELNHSSLVLWFSPFPNICTHALNMKAQFLVGHSSCMDDLPEVLWTGRGLASEWRTRACLRSDWRLQLTGVTWLLWGEPPGSSKDLRGGTAVFCASLMNLTAQCPCTGTWGQASSLQCVIFAHFWTFNHKLAIPTVLIKKVI